MDFFSYWIECLLAVVWTMHHPNTRVTASTRKRVNENNFFEIIPPTFEVPDLVLPFKSLRLEALQTQLAPKEKPSYSNFQSRNHTHHSRLDKGTREKSHSKNCQRLISKHTKARNLTWVGETPSTASQSLTQPWPIILTQTTFGKF